MNNNTHDSVVLVLNRVLLQDNFSAISYKSNGDIITLYNNDSYIGKITVSNGNVKFKDQEIVMARYDRQLTESDIRLYINLMELPKQSKI